MSTQHSSDWRPILEGEQREKALAAVRDASDALTPEASRSEGDFPDTLAQHALFHAYAGVSLDDASRFESVDRFLDAAISGLAGTAMHPGLIGGFTNVAWVVEHLQHHPFAPAGESDPDQDPNEEIDQALLGYLSRETWDESYDLVSGLVGYGIYALERAPRTVALECLRRIVDHLSAISSRKDGGITWWTPPERVATLMRDQWKDGQYNLGVAHGIPAIIGFLGLVQSKQLYPEKTQPLLSGAVSWLLNQKLPESSGASFPHSLGGAVVPGPSRSAWCYGDPGIAVTLLVAARSCPSLGLDDAAIEIASKAARRDPSRCGVVDAGLCHGAAGLGHLYNRLFQATRDSLFLDAARFWLGRALEMRAPGTGVGGFSPYFPKEDAVERRGQVTRGFLMGAGGIALALLAAISSVEPLWDRLLLAAVPPREVGKPTGET